MKKTSLLLAALAGFALSGCSSTGIDKKEIVAQELEIKQMRAEAMAEAAEVKTEKMQTEIDMVPDWVMENPRPDETGFYASGSSEDEQLFNAIRKANLKAKFNLVTQIKSSLSGEETLTGDGKGQFEFIINNFVDKVELSGYEVIESTTYASNGTYKSHRLYKLPHEALDSILNKQFSAGSELRDSYDRLMARIQSEETASKTTATVNDKPEN